MKTVKVTADNKVSVIDVDFSDFRDIQKALGGHFEVVHTKIMESYFMDLSVIMLVDEEGIIKGLPVNFVGSTLYGTVVHGNPIVGDILFAVAAGEDIVGLMNPEGVKKRLMSTFTGLKEA